MAWKLAWVVAVLVGVGVPGAALVVDTGTSVLGSASCTGGDFSCGYLGAGATSVLGSASCAGGADSSCGSIGFGATSVVGDASCTGQCGTLGGSNGLGAVSVAGHAHCSTELNVDHLDGARGAQCVGGKDVAEQLGAPL
jgi:hypothetical protein